MIGKLRTPSPALVIACIALFVSLSGTALATGVVPTAKRALFAKNAGKLQGKTAREVAAIPGPATSLDGLGAEDIASMEGPASTAGALVFTNTVPFALAPSEEKDFSAGCGPGAKAVSGGFASPNLVAAEDTRPTPDGNGWTVYLVNISPTASATGSMQVTCLR